MKIKDRSGRQTAAHFAGRVLAFVLIAGALLSVLHMVEIWMLPTWSADVAVAQLESSDRAAETLRLVEWVRAELPWAVAGLLMLVGAVLLVPYVGRRLRRFWDAHMA